MNTEQERAEFEAWANGRCELHLVNPAGRYSSAITQFAWEAYQAGRAALAAQAQEAAPAARGHPGAWHRIGEGAEVDVPLDTDLLLAWWDQWHEAWIIEVNYAGSKRRGWRHGRATHWMPLPAPPSAAHQKGASNG